jgi:hypothetical protein
MTGFVIGIGGQLENGKDVLADYLKQELTAIVNAPWERDAFAAEVKKVFENTFGVTREWIERWKRIDTPPPGFLKTVRQMLIDIGDGFRTFRADVWIAKALRRESQNVIISDARYLNEMGAIKSAGGVTVAVYRPDRDNNNPNASERQLREYIQKFIDADVRGPTGDALVDLFVVNDGTVKDLFAFADSVVVPFVAQKVSLAGRRTANVGTAIPERTGPQ